MSIIHNDRMISQLISLVHKRLSFWLC